MFLCFDFCERFQRYQSGLLNPRYTKKVAFFTNNLLIFVVMSHIILYPWLYFAVIERALNSRTLALVLSKKGCKQLKFLKRG
jgi:hypothetical protein